MKRSNLISSLLVIGLSLALTVFSFAQDKNKVENAKKEKNQVQIQKPITDPTDLQHGKNFVDENGDGYNDNAPDHDADGIPNGVDPDYDGPKVRSGNKGFIDENGDGINDNQGMKRGGKGKRGYGPGDGTGNSGVRPQDGTGNGAKAGDCDGTGPKGKTTRGGQK